ncbi:MAG: AAA family ATPase [Candidatus Brocadia sp. WS118]|nr:MAG: AAA family ATPase [Candidatus Brocadia sp. WS118]
MAKLKPWHTVVTPREDLRENKPLDASEFAVHLDQVRDGRANDDYQKPVRFFERTFLTKNLRQLAAEVIRRLSGEKTETSAVFNMATQFGGGKTHALTLLYHLANHGAKANQWAGVSTILRQAGIDEIPKAATAVFVGTEFDSLHGRGGDDGTPNRKTPWGEIAFQLSGEEGLMVVAEHEKQLIAPAGDVIRKFIPQDKPCLILMDELLNYISRNRHSGLGTQLYNFVQNLSEEARGSKRMVLVASIPASELEMTTDDRSDYERFKKMLDRLGKAVIMSAESETSEIIRRRLFEWDPRHVGEDGRILLTSEAVATCNEYADWLNDNRPQIPSWFSIDHAKETFQATYPFHPMVLSVFERKWQELPRFQRTRGILRLLALWVSHAYQEGFKGARKDPLIGLGTAPLEDPQFRMAVFEQLGESRLEGAVTTDICGKRDSNAVRLDQEAVDTIKKAQVHRKAVTTIFFESNGGQQKAEASLPEIRLAVAGPDLDIGNVETALGGLTDACYYLISERNHYRFSLKENLNKRFADRRASVRDQDIDSRVRDEIQRVFPASEGIERIFFPEKSSQIPDRPVITFVIMGPDQSLQEVSDLRKKIETMTKEYGKSARVYKSALIWIVPESEGQMREDARKLIAWEDIRDEGLKLDEVQHKQLDANIKKARRDLTESVWRAYKNILFLDKNNQIETLDLGLVTSSAAESLTKHILSALRQKDIIAKEVPARYLVRNWPPAFTEWNTRSVRDAFFASPQFPRLLYPETIKETIARGVSEHQLAYAVKSPKGDYDPFIYEKPLSAADVEISEDVFILTAAEADKHKKPPQLTQVLVSPSQVQIKPGKKQTFTVEALDQFGREYQVDQVDWIATGGEIGTDGVFTAGADEGNFIVTVKTEGKTATASITIAKEETMPPPPPSSGPKKLTWSGEVAPQKWTNLYMKVLTKLVSSGEVKIRVSIEAGLKEGVADQQVEETKAALRGLGLDDGVEVR